tara:strand:+ start:202 stop:1599 length:1398 start_codon:yes stop_codon:yes gene_type:complete
MHKKDRISIKPERQIIDDFADLITKQKRPEAKPSKTIISFRNDEKDHVERDVFLIKSEYLRFRKENGRIFSDVASYEQNNGILEEKSSHSQEIIRGFIKELDPQKNTEAYKSIQSVGQKEVAIITCDGFLINGNRRKLIIDQLYEDIGDEKYKSLKVVVLPGKDDPGGAPTIEEIEEIELRYQEHTDGKSEYTGLNQALSIRGKIDKGMTLDRIVRSNPKFSPYSPTEMKKGRNYYQKEYLGPLECVDDYLAMFGIPKLYNNISSGPGDPEGKWQSFYDYYSKVKLNLENPKKRNAMFGIEEDQIGKVETVAFKIIRKRKFQGLKKSHQIIRELPKLIKNHESRKELYHFIDDDEDLEEEEKFDKEGIELSPREQDLAWGQKNAELFQHRMKLALNNLSFELTKGTPITLINSALSSLNKVDISNIGVGDYKTARELCTSIKADIDRIEKDIFDQSKKLKKLVSK